MGKTSWEEGLYVIFKQYNIYAVLEYFSLLLRVLEIFKHRLYSVKNQEVRTGISQ
jgi:hypothetical protein